MKEVTKVQAVVKVLKAHHGKAGWATIYDEIERHYEGAKASAFWQEGIRGIVYREIRYERTFKMAEQGIVALR